MSCAFLSAFVRSCGALGFPPGLRTALMEAVPNAQEMARSQSSFSPSCRRGGPRGSSGSEAGAARRSRSAASLRREVADHLPGKADVPGDIYFPNSRRIWRAAFLPSGACSCRKPGSRQCLAEIFIACQLNFASSRKRSWLLVVKTQTQDKEWVCGSQPVGTGVPRPAGLAVFPV